MARGRRTGTGISTRGFIYKTPEFEIDAETGEARQIKNALSSKVADRYRREIIAKLGIDYSTEEGKRKYKQLYQRAKNKTQTFNMTTGSNYSPLAYFHAKVVHDPFEWTRAVKAIDATSGSKKITAKNVSASEQYMFGTVTRTEPTPGVVEYTTSGGRWSAFINTSHMPGQAGVAYTIFNDYFKIKNGDTAGAPTPLYIVEQKLKEIARINYQNTHGKNARPIANFY